MLNIKYFQAPSDLNVLTEATRKLGLIIIRGAMVSQVMSADNYQVIENPFAAE